MNSTVKQLYRISAVLTFSLLATGIFAQEDLRSTLFAQTDEALKAANEARASVLAPKAYADATK